MSYFLATITTTSIPSHSSGSTPGSGKIAVMNKQSLSFAELVPPTWVDCADHRFET